MNSFILGPSKLTNLRATFEIAHSWRIRIWHETKTWIMLKKCIPSKSATENEQTVKLKPLKFIIASICAIFFKNAFNIRSPTRTDFYKKIRLKIDRSQWIRGYFATACCRVEVKGVTIEYANVFITDLLICSDNNTLARRQYSGQIQ